MYFFFDDEPVVNRTNTTNLEFVEIQGLFSRYSVRLDFDKEVNVYIGENGLGKTTILNCVYYILNKRFNKLAEIDFNTIVVKFKDEDKIAVTINDVIKYNHHMSRHRVYDDEEIFAIIGDVLEGYNNDSFTIYDNSVEERIEIAVRKLYRITHMPVGVCRQAVVDYLRTGGTRNRSSNKGDYRKIEKLNEMIDKKINQRIIYLTTYRRIENDFTSLFRKEDEYLDSDMLIRFGMGDVEKSIMNILEKIKENSRESFNKMTSVLLRQYSSPQNIKYNILSHNKIDIKMLEIILDRLGNEIADNDKKLILSLFENEEIYRNDYSYLLNLISKLIENYEKQKIYDEKIKRFVMTCNKYLNDKQFVYDQSKLILYIELPAAERNNRIELSNLSSGEKQIVSLFSKLYLENEKDSILIIDEPELSISMMWQRMLLPDILRSDNCKLLLTVTHSPFIFDNEFDTDAKDMRACIDFYYGGK